MEANSQIVPERLFDHASNLLHEGVKGREHPFHFISLGSLGLSGIPTSRTVILRKFDPFHREIMFHSDIRSPKVAEMMRYPFVSLLFYSQPDKLQLRVTGKTSIHHQDDITKLRWEKTPTMSKLTYLTDYAPSTLYPNEEIQTPKATLFSRADDDLAYTRFCVINCHFYDMDITELHASGNIRARLSWDHRGTMFSERLVP